MTDKLTDFRSSAQRSRVQRNSRLACAVQHMEKPKRTLTLSDDFVLLEETRPFEKLSDDVVVEVLSWLEPKDLAKMARVSRYFNGILHDKTFRHFHRMKVRSVETRMASVRSATSKPP